MQHLLIDIYFRSKITKNILKVSMMQLMKVVELGFISFQV